MTRDEAMEIWNSENGDIIDKFAALGMLRLDDPKVELELVVKALQGRYFETELGHSPMTMVGALDVGMALRCAGLHIIGKGQ